MDLQIDPHAHLRAAFTAGCRIQAWHLNEGAANSNDGRWDTLTPPESRVPEFGCAPHLYRVHPEDEAKALQVWDFRMPTGHLPAGYRFYAERLASNTDPAALVRMEAAASQRVAELEALVDVLTGALKVTQMLRTLGGLLPGSREVVLTAVEAADAALGSSEFVTERPRG